MATTTLSPDTCTVTVWASSTTALIVVVGAHGSFPNMPSGKKLGTPARAWSSVRPSGSSIGVPGRISQPSSDASNAT